MPEAIDKTRRQRLILEILNENIVSSQDELVRLLKSRKVSVTQSTLSRDLKELKVTRASTGGAYRYRAPQNGDHHDHASPEQMREMAALVVTGLASNETVVTVRTVPARAQGLASFLDGLDLPDIIGTIAGDDTVMVIPSSVKKTRRLRRTLADLLQL